MSQDLTWGKIGEWLAGPTGPIWIEVVKMLHRRQIYRGFLEICRQAPDEVRDSGGEFQRWVMANYYRAQTVAIRSLNDTDRRTKSIRRLLEALKTVPEFEAESSADLKRLEVAVKPVKEFVDKRVAHLEDLNAREAAMHEITWDEIDRCVDLYRDVLVHYNKRVLNATLIPEPVITGHWEHAFTLPWIRGA